MSTYHFKPDSHHCCCRGMAGATPQSVREMFSAGMQPARPATAVLAVSDDEELGDEYRAKQPKGPFVRPSFAPCHLSWLHSSSAC